MKSTAAALLAAFCWSAPAAGQSASFDWFEYQGDDQLPAPKMGEYRNPILNGFYPDPSITRVGGRASSSTIFNIGVPSSPGRLPRQSSFRFNEEGTPRPRTNADPQVQVIPHTVRRNTPRCNGAGEPHVRFGSALSTNAEGSH